jgi:hypothetical protein
VRLETRIVPSSRPARATPAQVAREFRRLLEAGFRLHPAGRARRAPRMLLTRGYTPRYRIDLFDTTVYLTHLRQNPDVRFFVAYVVQAGSRVVHPRIFYKDVSLIWRSASHVVRTDGENWIGKGDLRSVVVDGEEHEVSAEETTDLPLELDAALEALCRSARRVPRDDVALELVLRGGHSRRIEPYRDFTAPRRCAAADPRNLVNGGRPIARFTRPGDPASLRFTPGFAPDFAGGVLERHTLKSRLYGGTVRRFRILSRNRKIQYLFFAGPHHAWIIPPQALTTQLSTYAVRTVDVIAPEELCIPGFEYHFVDDTVDPPVLHSQIPEGFVGLPSEHDPARADASRWIEALPVVREFRRRVLGEGCYGRSAGGRPLRASARSRRARVAGSARRAASSRAISRARAGSGRRSR